MANTNGVNGVNGHDISPIVTIDEFLKHEYEYLVLGGGTAGLTVAARLAEDPQVCVGVLEAGKDKTQDMLVNTPAMFPQMFGNPEYEWNYMSVAYEGTKAHHIVRGKMLGGSSAINYLLYVRGSDADYDDWAKIIGDDSWNAKNMKQYMRKHQKLEPIGKTVTDRSTMNFDGQNHGTEGPIHTSFNEWKGEIEDDVIVAAEKVTGFGKKPLDSWGGDHNGFYPTIGRSGSSKGKRSFAAAYISHQPNLKILCEAHVSRIDLDGDHAIGATFKHSDQEYSVKVKREVIVSGGTVGSPQILELSGIGNPDILAHAGIECKIKNSAIGENLQDHVAVNYIAQTPGIDTLDAFTRPEVIGPAMQAYMEHQGGPIATTSSVQGFYPYRKFASAEELSTTISKIESIDTQTEFAKRQRGTVIHQLKDENSANLQLLVLPATIGFKNGQEDQKALFAPIPDGAENGITLAGCIQYPVSRGSTHVKSSNPTDHPAYNPGFLMHQADIDVLMTCMKSLHQIAETEPFKSKLGKRIYPPPELDLTNSEDCKRAVMEFYLGVYHPVGSVAMGDALDSRLFVKGTKNIRVADASVFPGHVSGNIVSSCYMVGEKAADLIKEDWKKSSR